MSQYAIDYLHYTWQMLNGFRAQHEKSLCKLRERDILSALDMPPPLQILDVANGRLRPQFALLKAGGHHVYGIDLVNRPQANRKNLAYGVARELYRWKLGLSRDAMSDQTLICGDVGVLPFRDNSFDLVTSIAAFEHFLDVPAVVAELYRVLRPGALAWICIHLFSSPSGGHNLSFAEIPLRRVPEGVQPWDHLRSQRLPFHVPLNEWRMDQYVNIFGRYFELVKSYGALYEGEHLLTPEIEAELSIYTRDELTCYAYVILARKPTHSVDLSS